MLCYLEFFPSYVSWSFLHVMSPGVSYILCYLEFLSCYITWSFLHFTFLVFLPCYIAGVSSMLC